MNEMYLNQVGPKLQEIAMARWLLPEEIFLLLVNPPAKVGLPQTFAAPTNPQVGQIFVYDGRASFKQDGVVWAKKKGAADRLQETYMNLKVGGKDCIRGIYIKSASNPNFRRRIYRLSTKAIPQSYVLVHYRESTEDEKPERHTLQPLIAYFINQHQHLLNSVPATLPSSGDLNAIDQSVGAASNSRNAHNNSSNSSSIPVNDDFLDDFLDMDMGARDMQQDGQMPGPLGLAYQHSQSSIGDYSSSYACNLSSGDGYDEQQPGKAYGHRSLPALAHPSEQHSRYSSHSSMQAQQAMPYSAWTASETHSISFVETSQSLAQLAIVDFAPNRIMDGMEGVRCMICVTKTDGRQDLVVKLSGPGSEYQFMLQWISDNVAVWTLSGIEVGMWAISLVTSKNDFVCAATGFLEVLALPAPPEPVILPSRGKRSLEMLSPMASLGASGFGLLPSDMQDAAVSQILENDRQFKIRLVEKLGYLQSALDQDENAGGRSRSSSRPPFMLDGPRSRSSSRPPMAIVHDGTATFISRSRSSSRPPLAKDATGEAADGGEGMQWLDDIEVSNLSNKELEEAMDQYIISVVEQLVRLGSLDESLDEELRAEIEEVDANGLSLLHYCCLYNLTSLITPLLTRGADVNQVTKSGSTPLHLAIAAGNLAASQELLTNGANVHAVDGNGLTPWDLARESGRVDLIGLLCSVLNQPYLDPQTPPRVRRGGGGGAGGEEEDADAASRTPATGSSLTAMLLQQSFNTLSLTDKCALSLTLGHLAQTPSISNLQALNLNGTASRASIASNSSTDGSLHEPTTWDGSAQQGMGDHATTFSGKRFSLKGGAAAGTGVGVGVGSGPLSLGGALMAPAATEDISDIQSVISETDKESLDAAMAMMGPVELEQVEEEVRKIQNNVRGWLLRKNYTNLREATRLLQSAWRERRKASQMPSKRSGAGSEQMPLDSIDEKMEMDPGEDDSPPMPRLSKTLASTGEVHGLRGSFRLPPGSGSPGPSNISHHSNQAVASLIIQKNLVRWWTHSRPGLFIQEKAPRPVSVTSPAQTISKKT